MYEVFFSGQFKRDVKLCRKRAFSSLLAPARQRQKNSPA